jgi:hypothetical protein
VERTTRTGPTAGKETDGIATGPRQETTGVPAGGLGHMGWADGVEIRQVRQKRTPRPRGTARRSKGGSGTYYSLPWIPNSGVRDGSPPGPYFISGPGSRSSYTIGSHFLRPGSQDQVKADGHPMPLPSCASCHGRRSREPPCHAMNAD